MEYKYPSIRGLKNYNYILDEELIYLLNSQFLFGRKFNKECFLSLNNKIYIDFISS